MSPYSIWILEFANIPNFPVSGIKYGVHNEGTRKLPYCYVLIKGNGRTIMVDVGYNHRDYGQALAKQFGVGDWHSPRDVLAECNVTPEEVDTVFVTHAHFDHFGNTDAFPNARFYLQERELSKWIWAMALPDRLNWTRTGLDPSDILRAVDLASQGRLICVEGEIEDVAPGIDLRVAFDSHTFGCMWVHVRNDLASSSHNSWVLAGDLVYVYDNMLANPKIDQGDITGRLEYRPVGLAQNSNTNLVLATEEMLKAVDYEAKRVIPVHEDRLSEVFPTRVTDKNLRIMQVCLGEGETSRV